MIKRMPVLFIGHGSPMNAIEDQAFTRTWRQVGAALPRPRAILAISAHWFVSGSHVNDQEQPRQIYDMYNFPRQLYELVYPAPGAPQIANRVKQRLAEDVAHRWEIDTDNSWGTDHGTWSVLVHLFPEADIPVCSLSIDRGASPQAHFALGKQLSELRDEGVLILGSGNIVHNLRRVNFDQAGGEDWAVDFDQIIADRILSQDYASLFDPAQLSDYARLAIPTPDHYWPLLYAVGAAQPGDSIQIFNQACQYGSLSMTSYQFG